MPCTPPGRTTPTRGAAANRSWSAGPAPRTSREDWRFEWSLLGSDGDLAFVQGRTTYLDDRPNYENLWVIRLDSDGRASGFTEWFMEQKV
jgi:hypothetical protein